MDRRVLFTRMVVATAGLTLGLFAATSASAVPYQGFFKTTTGYGLQIPNFVNQGIPQTSMGVRLGSAPFLPQLHGPLASATNPAAWATYLGKNVPATSNNLSYFPAPGQLGRLFGRGLGSTGVAGSGTNLDVGAAGTSYASVMIPANAFFGTGFADTFTVPTTQYPYIKSYTGAPYLGINAGTLSKSGGPGSFSFCLTVLGSQQSPCVTTAGVPRVKYTQNGANRFGGTANLLGVWTNKLLIASTFYGGYVTNALPINVRVVGGPVGNTWTGAAPIIHQTVTTGNGNPLSFPGYLTITGFPWTTGMVVQTDMSGVVYDAQSTSGYNNRNAAGTTGFIQVVSGGLYHYTGIAVDRGVFTNRMVMHLPEPGAAAALAAGLLLPILYRRRNR